MESEVLFLTMVWLHFQN